jgi:aryl-alcohol dehydrogenase-like predicted oxidoreductase
MGRASVTVAALSFPDLKQDESNRDARPAALPTVKLRSGGKTVPIVGLGGFPIAKVKSENEAIGLLESLFRKGVRYVDTAPSYRDYARGFYSEARIGKVLGDAQFDRAEFYIATKTLERGEAGARQELEASLKRLRTDHVDAVQVHRIEDDFKELDPDRGVLKALLRAREEGLLKQIGVTVHTHPRYALGALERFAFELILMPINPIDPQHHSFIHSVLPVARAKKIDVIAMKVYAGGRLVGAKRSETIRVTAEECLRYALSQPGVTVAVPGIRSRKEAEVALGAVTGFEPLSTERLAAIEKKTGPHEKKRSEWYKEV